MAKVFNNFVGGVGGVGKKEAKIILGSDPMIIACFVITWQCQSFNRSKESEGVG